MACGGTSGGPSARDVARAGPSLYYCSAHKNRKFDGVREQDDGDGGQKPTGKAELWGRGQLWREALWSEEPVGGASAAGGMGGGDG